MSFNSCSKRCMMVVGYGVGVLRIERARENGFYVEEEANKKRFIERG